MVLNSAFQCSLYNPQTSLTRLVNSSESHKTTSFSSPLGLSINICYTNIINDVTDCWTNVTSAAAVDANFLMVAIIEWVALQCACSQKDAIFRNQLLAACRQYAPVFCWQWYVWRRCAVVGVSCQSRSRQTSLRLNQWVWGWAELQSFHFNDKCQKNGPRGVTAWKKENMLQMQFLFLYWPQARPQHRTMSCTVYEKSTTVKPSG